MLPKDDQGLSMWLTEQIDVALSGLAAHFIIQDAKTVMLALRKLAMTDQDFVHKLNQAIQNP